MNCTRCGKEAAVTKHGLGIYCASLFYKDADKISVSDSGNYLIAHVENLRYHNPVVQKHIAGIFKDDKEDNKADDYKAILKKAGSKDEFGVYDVENSSDKRASFMMSNILHIGGFEGDLSYQCNYQTNYKLQDDVFSASDYAYDTVDKNGEEVFFSGIVPAFVFDYTPAITYEPEFYKTNPLTYTFMPKVDDRMSENIKDITSIRIFPFNQRNENEKSAMLTDAESTCSLDTVRKFQNDEKK